LIRSNAQYLEKVSKTHPCIDLHSFFALGPLSRRADGQAVQSVRTAFSHAVELAGLDDDVTPHTLRHTCATWLMRAGVDKWEAAGFLGMTVEMLHRLYGHHHPNHLRTATEAIGYGRGTPIVGSADEG
jgi:integrase